MERTENARRPCRINEFISNLSSIISIQNSFESQAIPAIVLKNAPILRRRDPEFWRCLISLPNRLKSYLSRPISVILVSRDSGDFSTFEAIDVDGRWCGLSPPMRIVFDAATQSDIVSILAKCPPAIGFQTLHLPLYLVTPNQLMEYFKLFVNEAVSLMWDSLGSDLSAHGNVVRCLWPSAILAFIQARLVFLEQVEKTRKLNISNLAAAAAAALDSEDEIDVKGSDGTVSNSSPNNVGGISETNNISAFTIAASLTDSDFGIIMKTALKYFSHSRCRDKISQTLSRSSPAAHARIQLLQWHQKLMQFARSTSPFLVEVASTTDVSRQRMYDGAHETDDYDEDVDVRRKRLKHEKQRLCLQQIGQSELSNQNDVFIQNRKQQLEALVEHMQVSGRSNRSKCIIRGSKAYSQLMSSTSAMKASQNGSIQNVLNNNNDLFKLSKTNNFAMRSSVVAAVAQEDITSRKETMAVLDLPLSAPLLDLLMNCPVLQTVQVAMVTDEQIAGSLLVGNDLPDGQASFSNGNASNIINNSFIEPSDLKLLPLNSKMLLVAAGLCAITPVAKESRLLASLQGKAREAQGNKKAFKQAVDSKKNRSGALCEVKGVLGAQRGFFLSRLLRLFGALGVLVLGGCDSWSMGSMMLVRGLLDIGILKVISENGSAGNGDWFGCGSITSADVKLSLEVPWVVVEEVANQLRLKLHEICI